MPSDNWSFLEELPNPWLRVGYYCFCLEDIASLFVWGSCGYIHLPQEPTIYVHLEETQSQKKEMVRTTQGL